MIVHARVDTTQATCTLWWALDHSGMSCIQMTCFAPQRTHTLFRCLEAHLCSCEQCPARRIFPPSPPGIALLCRDLLYLDLALENVVRAAAERGTGAAGGGAGALIGPLLQNLVLSTGDNEELCYCLKAWQDLPREVRFGQYPNREHALKVGDCDRRLWGTECAGTPRIVGNMSVSTRLGLSGLQR